ncbi:MAG: hypothetical protein KGI99_17250 [Bradyrhizobium sp.]|uniref:hypothetical protein n=1 Tax=Bradyrhizobium sp. TaxID=376 RepID=UPI001C296C98|nr:hypothetical protein [Bradyrhizobium sp.]MBU6464921.1 hypothetical protein [Pseudomonadota bacterium]MDE2068897.1 hypothetical protein [Bradyrhizobium sp.]
MKVSTHPMRRGFINEVAFAAFCQSASRNESWPLRKLTKSELDEAVASVHSLSIRREVGGERISSQNFTADELFDIEEQRSRLSRIFSFNRPAGSLIVEPIFPGCGIVDASKGDLIVSNVLFEVKAGDRLFRSIDIRQLIMYSAMNHISKRFRIEKLGLFNPRVGVSAIISIDDLCDEISGRQSVELFSEIVAAISSGEVSR